MKYFSKSAICNQMHKHASKKEARRCDELSIFEKQGIIKLLKQQPEFILQEGFKFRGETIRAIKYMADFSYYDNEKKCFFVEDTKGFKTPVYIMKKKMLLNIMKERDDFQFLES